MTWRMPDLLRVLTLLLCLCVPVLANADTIYCADEDFTPAGNDGNSGATAALPKTDGWCRDPVNVSAGDILIYASGNYEGEDFEIDGMDGTSGAFITHQCATKYGCSFSRWRVLNSSFLELIWLKSDSNFWDSTHSGGNPRVRIWGTNDLTLTAVFIRGQPAFDYNDVFEIGDSSGADSRRSHSIVIRSTDALGSSQVLETTHSQTQIHNDNDGYSCGVWESNYAIIGTPDTPVIYKTKYHHSLSNKGACTVLIQHVDFQQTGTGRGDLIIPNYTSWQSGGTHHGSSYRHYAIRFNTYSYGGGPTDARTAWHQEVGAFGDDPSVAEDVCMAHNSSWRPWGGEVQVTSLNEITNVEDIYVLNYASDEGNYLYETTGVGPTYDEALGYSVSADGDAQTSNIFFDGYVFDIVADLEGDKFLWDNSGDNTYASTDCPTAELGDTTVGCGAVSYSNTQFFTDPANRDYTINAGDPASLTAAAVPIATVSGTGSGTTISLTETRGGCFMAPIGVAGKGYGGDTLDINGEECTVSAVDYASATNTITCNETINYVDGENIRFKIDGAIMDDIGAIPAGASEAPGNPAPGIGRQLGRVNDEAP